MLNKWSPEIDELQTTSIWNFPDRGNWATHNASYRGNWSPYIPRNIIKRYSKPDDIILDAFVGSGTTVIETKLLERRSIGVDINPMAIKLCQQNLSFKGKNEYEPRIINGDARNLDFIQTNSIDLICTHPPYANIIEYSKGIVGDISLCELDKFLVNMREVSNELFRVLKPNKYCAFLMGDMRKNRSVIPLGFKTLQIFEESGFELKEIVIKEQHGCASTSKWVEKSKQYNFLLLAHEYLFIMRKNKAY